MKRIFFDASVLFAAAYSKTGSARDLILLALDGLIEVIVSLDVLSETERNLTRKAPEKIGTYHQLLEIITPTIVADPTKEAVWAAEAYVVQKDAPIVAAALNAQVDYLVTYDRKHLIEPLAVTELSRLRIVTPDVVVQVIKAEGAGEDESI